MPLKIISSLEKECKGLERACNLNLVYSDFSFIIYSDWLSSIGKKNEVTIQTDKFDIHFSENNQSRTLEKAYAETKDNWTNLASHSYFPSKGIDRNINADPLGSQAKQTALQAMLAEYISDLKKSNSPLASTKLRDAIVANRLVMQIYSCKNGLIEL